MTHVPDHRKIPQAMIGMDWKLASDLSPDHEFECKILAAVPTYEGFPGKEINEDYHYCFLFLEPCGDYLTDDGVFGDEYQIGDFDFYVELDE